MGIETYKGIPFMFGVFVVLVEQCANWNADGRCIRSLKGL